MPEQGTQQDDTRYREQGRCPVCGQEPAEVDRINERVNGQETEKIPGRWYDHDGDGLCIEWADGEVVQNE